VAIADAASGEAKSAARQADHHRAEEVAGRRRRRHHESRRVPPCRDRRTFSRRHSEVGGLGEVTSTNKAAEQLSRSASKPTEPAAPARQPFARAAGSSLKPGKVDEFRGEIPMYRLFWLLACLASAGCLAPLTSRLDETNSRLAEVTQKLDDTNVKLV